MTKHRPSTLTQALQTLWLYYGTDQTAAAISSGKQPARAFRDGRTQRGANTAWTNFQKELNS